MRHFGPHLLMDFFCTSDRLNDQEYMKQLLIDMTAEIGMKVLEGPIVADTSCSNEGWLPSDVTGLSGSIVISGSHLYFHTFVEVGYVFFDVFSCQDFDVAAASTWLKKELGITQSDVQMVKRGLNFPRKNT